MSQPIDLRETFVQLQAAGGASTAAWTPEYWRRTSFAEGDRVVGARHAASPADLHADELEMHPRGDEVLLMVSGAVDVVLEEPAGPRVIELHAGQACVVPRGIWHRLVLKAPGDLVFVTPPVGTQLRPVTPP